MSSLPPDFAGKTPPDLQNGFFQVNTPDLFLVWQNGKLKSRPWGNSIKYEFLDANLRFRIDEAGSGQFNPDDYFPVDDDNISNVSFNKVVAGTVQGQQLIVGISDTVNSFIRSENWDGGFNEDNEIFDPGTQGWIINSDGTAILQNAIVRGNITADEGLIGQWDIGLDGLSSGAASTFVALSAANLSDYRIWAGDETASEAPFSIQRDGTLFARRGQVGGWELDQTLLTSGSGSTYVALSSSEFSTGVFWAGNEAFGLAPFRVSRGGDLFSTSGEIGGWSIGEDRLTAGETVGDFVALSVTGDYRIWAGNVTAANAPFSVEKDGTLFAVEGTVGGWLLGADELRSTSSGAGISLNQTQNRVVVFDSVQDKAAMGYLSGLPKYDGSGNWGSNDYGFWVRQGDNLVIDGDVEYENGDWLIENDASMRIQTPDGNDIIRIGTVAGDKGLFFFDGAGNDPANVIGEVTANSINLGNKFTWDGTTLTIVGDVTADSGEIGGWSIGADMLSAGSGADNYVALSSDDASDFRIWAGDLLGNNAPFWVKKDGSMRASSGEIAGWNIGTSLLPDALFSGSGSTFVALNSATEDEYSIWAGNDVAASAPFSVQRDGTITAQVGILSGWAFANNRLNSGIGSTYVALDASSDPFSIWAGAENPNSAPFSVRSNGQMVATSGTVGGWEMTPTRFRSFNQNIEFISGGGTEAIEIGSDFWNGDGSFQFGGTQGVSWSGSGDVLLGSDTEIAGRLTVGASGFGQGAHVLAGRSRFDAAQVGSVDNQGLRLTVTETVHIASVEVQRTSGSGDITINLRDGHGQAGSILQSVSYTVSQSGGVRLSLDFILTPGDYTLTATNIGGSFRFNSSNNQFPYENGSFTVVNSATNDGSYYYFYDLSISGIGTEGFLEDTTTITGDQIRTGLIRSNNWGASEGSEINLNDGTVILGGGSGLSGDYLRFDGTNLTITGTLVAADGTFSGTLDGVDGTFTGTLSANSIEGGVIESSNWGGDNGSRIDLTDGTFQFGGGPNQASPYLEYDGTNLNIDGGSFDFGTITASLLRSASNVTFSTTTGVFLGEDNGTYKFRVGDPNGNKIEWDGEEFTVVGLVPNIVSAKLAENVVEASPWTGTGPSVTINMSTGLVAGQYEVTNTDSGTGQTVTVSLFRGSTQIASNSHVLQPLGAGGETASDGFQLTDTPGSGDHTYEIRYSGTTEYTMTGLSITVIGG